MKYLILLSLIFSITFAETTLTDEQLSDLHLKIEQCKLYKEENILLNDKMLNCESIVSDYEAEVATKFAAFKALFDVPVDSDGKPTGNAPMYDWPDSI